MPPFTDSLVVLDKKSARKKIQAVIRDLSKNYVLTESEKITRKVLAHPAYLKSKRISIYLSTPQEVQTVEILRHAFYMNKACFVPRFFKHQMVMLRLTDMQDYVNLPCKNKFGIKQPCANDENREDATQSGGIDLFILPGLAFTSDGRRLGHGKGHYDKYLHQHQLAYGRRGFYALALAFSEQLVDHVPTNEHDFRLDEVIWNKTE